MPKLKFNDYLVDDEDSALKSNTPVSNTYGVRPSMVTGHGLSSLRDIVNSMQSKETKQMENEVKPKRTYKKRAMRNNSPRVRKFTDIKGKAIAQVVATLDALNCSYKIVSPENHVFTRGVVFSGDENKKRKIARPYGTVAAYYKPYVVGLKVGETAVIPKHKEISADDIQCSATAWMAGAWGKGSYATMINKSREVEVLRIK
jgi:hypothetical protein